MSYKSECIRKAGDWLRHAFKLSAHVGRMHFNSLDTQTLFIFLIKTDRKQKKHPEHAGFPLSQRVDEQTNMTIKTNTSSSYAGAVEEVTDGEERCQDTLESLVLGQLLHTQLQVKERFCNLLFPQTERWREDRRV